MSELILGGLRLPGAMVDLALGLNPPENKELFLPGGTSQAMLLRPRTLALAARDSNLFLSIMVLNLEVDFLGAFFGGGSLTVSMVTLLARCANLQT